MTEQEDSRIRYALEVLLGCHALGCVPIFYRVPPVASPPVGALYVVPSSFFGTSYGTEASLPRTPLQMVCGVPLLFGTPLVEQRGKMLVVYADIIASAFFLLSRYEEWVRPDVRDKHGRFPGYESLLFRAGILHRPIVDEYAALLRKWTSDVGIELPSTKRRFSVLLTHDVDSLGPERGPAQAMRCIASGALGRRSMRTAVSDAATAVGLRRHACDNLDEVIREDRRLTDRVSHDRCGSIFFFMTGGDSLYDCGYRIKDARMISRLQEVLALGAGIGLHASYAAGAEPHRVSTERWALQDAAGIPIIRNRHHVLGWREPEHGAVLAAAGITWDSTLGYADVAGFRLGVCRPVPLFDPAGRCLIGIEEHPLIVMDCTLNLKKYMNLCEEAAFEHVRSLADTTFRHQGEFVCLWHNTVLTSTDTSYHKRLYSRVLDYLAELLDRV